MRRPRKRRPQSPIKRQFSAPDHYRHRRKQVANQGRIRRTKRVRRDDQIHLCLRNAPRRRIFQNEDRQRRLVSAYPSASKRTEIFWPGWGSLVSLTHRSLSAQAMHTVESSTSNQPSISGSHASSRGCEHSAHKDRSYSSSAIANVRSACVHTGPVSAPKNSSGLRPHFNAVCRPRRQNACRSWASTLARKGAGRPHCARTVQPTPSSRA